MRPLRRFGVPAAEFVGGLAAARVAVSLESLVLMAGAVVLAVVGVHGLVLPKRTAG